MSAEQGSRELAYTWISKRIAVKKVSRSRSTSNTGYPAIAYCKAREFLIQGVVMSLMPTWSWRSSHDATVAIACRAVERHICIRQGGPSSWVACKRQRHTTLLYTIATHSIIARQIRSLPILLPRFAFYVQIRFPSTDKSHLPHDNHGRFRLRTILQLRSRAAAPASRPLPKARADPIAQRRATQSAARRRAADARRSRRTARVDAAREAEHLGGGEARREPTLPQRRHGRERGEDAAAEPAERPPGAVRQALQGRPGGRGRRAARAAAAAARGHRPAGAQQRPATRQPAPGARDRGHRPQHAGGPGPAARDDRAHARDAAGGRGVHGPQQQDAEGHGEKDGHQQDRHDRDHHRAGVADHRGHREQVSVEGAKHGWGKWESWTNPTAVERDPTFQGISVP
nr:hypothetical protein CFP56_63491 [Quercus suber]